MQSNHLKHFVSLLLLFVSVKTFAQPNKGEFLNVSMGLGNTTCYYDVETEGSGFGAEVEYVWAPLSWFGIRPYAGVIFAEAESKKGELFQADVKTNAFLLGTKFRVAAPIRYVAPYIESGIGLSVGNFKTFVFDQRDIDKSGVFAHVPITLGLAVGRKHNIEIKMTYFYQYSVRQIYATAGVGFSIPLNEH